MELEDLERAWMGAIFTSLGNMNQTIDAGTTYSELLVGKINEGKAYNYLGNTTTPPCTESVDWWIIQEPLGMVEESLEDLLPKMSVLETTDDGKIAQPIQPLNGRSVLEY